MPFQRDPLSVRFDDAARQLVERAYAKKGEWTGQYVAPPGPRALAWLAVNGINPWERDRWGEQRWIRAYKRSVYHLVNWYGGTTGLRETPNLGAGGDKRGGGWHSPCRVQWETGPLTYRQGWATRKRAVRIRIHAGGSKTSRIGRAAAEAAGDSWIDAKGRPTDLQSTAADHDW